MASSFLRFLVHTQRRTTVSRTPLDEWSARRRDLYRTTHNTHNRQTSMPPVGFEPTVSAGERPQTYALDRAATGTGKRRNYWLKISEWVLQLPLYSQLALLAGEVVEDNIDLRLNDQTYCLESSCQTGSSRMSVGCLRFLHASYCMSGVDGYMLQVEDFTLTSITHMRAQAQISEERTPWRSVSAHIALTQYYRLLLSYYLAGVRHWRQIFNHMRTVSVESYIFRVTSIYIYHYYLLLSKRISLT